jgi:hypothetical protein
MIDGEKVPYRPIQGEVLPSMANVLLNELSLFNSYNIPYICCFSFIIIIFLSEKKHNS